MKTFFKIFLFAFAIVIVSCGDDADGVDCNDENSVFAFFTEKSNTYLMEVQNLDPNSSEYCEKYKEFTNDYLDAVEGFEDCLSGDGLTNYIEDLEETRQQLMDLTC